MLKVKLKPGYWFVNIAPIGEKPEWVEQPEPYKSPYLFGHEPNKLLAKQYK